MAKTKTISVYTVSYGSYTNEDGEIYGQNLGVFLTREEARVFLDKQYENVKEDEFDAYDPRDVKGSKGSDDFTIFSIDGDKYITERIEERKVELQDDSKRKHIMACADMANKWNYEAKAIMEGIINDYLDKKGVDEITLSVSEEDIDNYSLPMVDCQVSDEDTEELTVTSVTLSKSKACTFNGFDRNGEDYEDMTLEYGVYPSSFSDMALIVEKLTRENP